MSDATTTTPPTQTPEAKTEPAPPVSATEAFRGPDEIVVTSPATGEVVGRVTATRPADVRAVVEAARTAQKSWGALRVKDRCAALWPFITKCADRLDHIAKVLVDENGKSWHDAVGEGTALFTAAYYYLKKGPAILKDRKIDALGSLIYNARTVYHPRGVVGLISPWNYPFIIPLYEALAAWVAGNAVVLKPSEWTPLAAQLAKDLWDEAGMPPDLFRIVHGHGDVGAALIESGVDKIHFTGSVRVGKIIGRECGARLIPCTLELGGKAPAVVTEDADVDSTAKRLVWGKFFNSGQTCIGVERVYAVGRIAEPLTRRIVELTREVRHGPGTDPSSVMGAMTFPDQVDVCQGQCDDAREKGAMILTGGQREDGPGRFFPPTVIKDVNHDMSVMREETFGPVLPIMQVSSDEEAIRLANDSHLGLNAYVFAGSKARGEEIAAQVRAGTILIGDTIVNFALAGIPFGGVKESGVGRSHGAASLLAMSEGRTVVRPRLFSFPMSRFLGYPYSKSDTERTLRLTKWYFGSGEGQ